MPQCACNPCGRRRRWWQGAHAGVWLDGAWVCSQACVERLARGRLGEPPASGPASPAGRPAVRLGALLRHHGACRPEQIDEALAAQAQSHLRLGEQLLAMGAVQGPAVLRALAAQAGVSYLTAVDLDHVHDVPGGLSLDAVLALGVLPLGPPDGDRMRVAFPAPVPRPALTAFRAQTGWTPDPFLVSDDEWQVLVRHYRALRDAQGVRAGRALPPVADADEAARRIADAVMAAGDARLRDARWGHHVWVRVLSAAAPVDVLFAHAAALSEAKEERWLAATTSH
jgi:hypothetical protein